MTGLVDLIFPDGIFALDTIQHIGEARKITHRGMETRSREITFADGSTRVMGVAFVDRLMRRPVQLMAADVGTFALHAWSEANDRGVNMSPVIAWALCVDGDVRPVTPQGVNDGDMMEDGGGYVLMATGSVQSVGEHVEPVWFDTVEEYSQHMWSRQAELRAAAARPSPPLADQPEGNPHDR